jgi:MFS family permease
MHLTVPLMPNEMLAIVMLCLRFCISQMDTPARNAYVQGVVHPDERSAANGVTNVVRSVGAAAGPFFAGFLFANKNTSNYPWIIAGTLKIIYDLLLLYNMQAVKPDVEIDHGQAGEIKEEEEEDEGEEIEMQGGERRKEKEWERGSGSGGGNESLVGGVGVVVGVGVADEEVPERSQSSVRRDLEGQ